MIATTADDAVAVATLSALLLVGYILGRSEHRRRRPAMKAPEARWATTTTTRSVPHPFGDEPTEAVPTAEPRSNADVLLLGGALDG